MLLGEDAENILLESKAAVFGVGGVGGHCVDALVRCGLGRIAIFDSAKVKPSNLNRQICAKKSTVGMKKVEAMSLHIADVSDCITEAFDCFVTRENAEELIPADADIIIDAVDNVTAKIALVEASSRCGIPILSSMGAGNRLEPDKIRIADIFETSIDPLSRVMRRELRKRGIKKLKVVYSVEEPKTPVIPVPDPDMKLNAPASVPFVPGAFGLALASEAVRTILERKRRISFNEKKNTTTAKVYFIVDRRASFCRDRTRRGTACGSIGSRELYGGLCQNPNRQSSR